MHIGLLTADLSAHHGWGQYSLNLARALAQAGARVTVVAAENSPQLPDGQIHLLLPNLIPRVRRLPLKLWQARGVVWEVLQDCDLIHTTVEPYAPLAGWCAGKRPYSITGHGSFVQSLLSDSGIRGVLYRRAFAGAARIICGSRFTEACLRSRLPHARSAVIPNGIDTERFAGWNRKPVETWPPTVLAVGAIKPRKGFLPLVEAIAVAREQIPDLRCVLIGDMTTSWDYVAQIQAAIERHALSDCVSLLGRVSEETLHEHYAKASVFCLPTQQIGQDFEGYGLVYLEAGLAGLPVIATDAGGVGDVVQDGVNGLLLPAGEVAKRLPEAIVTLINDRQLALQLGEQGRARARALSWDSIAERYLTLYEEELRAHSANP